MQSKSLKWSYPIITASLFAGSFVAAKYSTLDLGPLATSLLRYIVTLILLAILVTARKRISLKIDKTDILTHVMLGLFCIVGSFSPRYDTQQ